MEIRRLELLIRFRNDQLRNFWPKPKVHLRQPRHQSYDIFPGCYQLQYLIEQMYCEMEKEHPVFCSLVSQSSFAYYCAVVVYNRILHLRAINNDTLTKDEKHFMKQVDALRLKIPLLLQCYIAGMGNVNFHTGHCREKYVFRTHPIKYVSSSDGAMGWFGRVGPDTHFLYQKYPCLTVFAKRIVEEFDCKPGQDWNLPEDITPEAPNAGAPSENLIGYSPCQPLLASQKVFLKRCDIDETRFPTANDTFCLSLKLLNEVRKELLAEKQLKLFGLNIRRADGSVAQLPYHRLSEFPPTHVDDPLHPIEVDGPFRQYSKYRFPNALHVAALRFQYQLKCVVDEKLNMWSVYDFNRFKDVPEEWRDTMKSESNAKIDDVANYYTKKEDWSDLVDYIFDLNGKTFMKESFH